MSTALKGLLFSTNLPLAPSTFFSFHGFSKYFRMFGKTLFEAKRLEKNYNLYSSEIRTLFFVTIPDVTNDLSLKSSFSLIHFE